MRNMEFLSKALSWGWLPPQLHPVHQEDVPSLQLMNTKAPEHLGIAVQAPYVLC